MGDDSHTHTQLEDLYLCVRKKPEASRTLDAAVIAGYFVEDVRFLTQELTGSGPFHPARNRDPLVIEGMTIRDPSVSMPTGAIGTTTRLQAALARRPRFHVEVCPGHEVEKSSGLDFEYVDREIVATRAIRQGSEVVQGASVKLDLLLVNADARDRTPIVGEAKIRTDCDPEEALIQALLYASLLAPAHQRQRLIASYPDQFGTKTPARIDVYVVLAERPDNAPERASLKRAIDLAHALGNQVGLARYLRRIIFIEACVESGVLRFRTLGPPAVVDGGSASTVASSL